MHTVYSYKILQYMLQLYLTIHNFLGKPIHLPISSFDTQRALAFLNEDCCFYSQGSNNRCRSRIGMFSHIMTHHGVSDEWLSG